MQMTLQSLAYIYICLTDHVLQCTGVGSLPVCMKSSVFAVTQSTGSLSCIAALSSEECILPNPLLQCIGVESLHTCMHGKSS